MSAQQYRAAVKDRIHEMLYGNGTDQSRGVVATVVSGAPREYAVYRDLTGFIRALLQLQDIVLDEVYRELFEPKQATADQQQPRNVLNEGA